MNFEFKGTEGAFRYCLEDFFLHAIILSDVRLYDSQVWTFHKSSSVDPSRLQ